MGTEVTVKLNFVVQHMSKENCDKLNLPYGTLEILDPDGDRQDTATDFSSAKEKISECIHDYGFYTFDTDELDL